LEEKKDLWRNALSHFRGDHSRCRHAPNGKEPLIQDDETTLIEAMTIFLSTTAKYFDLLEAGVRTQVNESLNSRRTWFASKNLAWADSWVAKMFLAVPHFNNPYLYLTDLVQKIGFDLPEAYYQSLHELFVRSIKTRQHRTGERTRSISVGKGPSPGVRGAPPSRHLPAATARRPTGERDDSFSDASSDSGDDDIEGDEYSDPDGVGPSAPGARIPSLVAG
jgi:hypothetical protein